LFFGNSRLMFLRLCSRAPLIIILSIIAHPSAVSGCEHG
jgi:hypothetical protein